MKKYLILLLSVAMILAFTACGGSEEAATSDGDQVQQESQEEQVEEQAAETESEAGFSGTKTGKFYHQFTSGKLYMEYETELEGQKMSVVTATNGEKTYVESKIDGTTSSASIMDGEVMYTIDHNSKMIVKMSLQQDIQSMAANIMEESDVDMNAYKTGKRTIDGKEYDTEEWNAEDGTSIMCFDGEELAYIVGVYEDEEIAMKIIEVSGDVDDGLFELPEDYELMEL